MLQLASGGKPQVLYRAMLGPYAANTTTNVTIPHLGDISRCLEKLVGPLSMIGIGIDVRIRLISPTNLEVVTTIGGDNSKCAVEIVRAVGNVYRDTIAVAVTAGGAPGSATKAIPNLGNLATARLYLNGGSSASGGGYGVTGSLELVDATTIEAWANVYANGSATLAFAIEY